MDELTYRLGTAEDVPSIVGLLDAGGLEWPGASATPYVAVTPDGEVVAVFFKTLCFHAEPLAAKPGANFSVTKLADLMRDSFRELANEIGPVTAYTSVQDNPKALEAARKNGMERVPGVLHKITIMPDPTE